MALRWMSGVAINMYLVLKLLRCSFYYINIMAAVAQVAEQSLQRSQV